MKYRACWKRRHKLLINMQPAPGCHVTYLVGVVVKQGGHVETPRFLVDSHGKLAPGLVEISRQLMIRIQIIIQRPPQHEAGLYQLLAIVVRCLTQQIEQI